jgi:hypothetical protein
MIRSEKLFQSLTIKNQPCLPAGLKFLSFALRERPGRFADGIYPAFTTMVTSPKVAGVSYSVLSFA